MLLFLAPISISKKHSKNLCSTTTKYAKINCSFCFALLSLLVLQTVRGGKGGVSGSYAWGCCCCSAEKIPPPPPVFKMSCVQCGQTFVAGDFQRFVAK